MSWLRSDPAKVVATTLCVAGALMLGYASYQYAAGAYRADLARSQWVEQQARAEVANARDRASAVSQTALERVSIGAPVARLQIPRIGLDEIVLEGVGDDELNAGPGHLPGSVLPGVSGNAIISAHRDRHFHRLDELQLGDTIRTETGHSSGLWVIVGRRVVERATPALFTANEPQLTLTTCWPVRYFGSAPDRLILSAKPVAGTWVGSSSRQRGRT
ncbi:MAG TPA: class D sortase [Gemmatimonadaceae bacterium]|nr:class D sortase [Gemmatimonadaceae bacterium]